MAASRGEQRRGGRQGLALLVGALALAAVVLLAVGRGGGGTGPMASGQVAAPATTPVGTATPAATTTAPARERCARARLTLADLPALDGALADGVKAATERAQAWQPDARLIALQVGCDLLEPAFRWRGTFFSDSAQTYFMSDTGETRPADPAFPPGQTLSLAGVSFAQLRRSLLRAGYDDTVELNPTTGVEIRWSTNEAPFGPPCAPVGAGYFHVAVAMRGEVTDLFVAITDSTIYDYSAAC